MQLFVVGHDCGHRSFSKNKLVEDIVGTLMFMPLIYPFEPWRIKHNHHHAHTNKCDLFQTPAWCLVVRVTVRNFGPVLAGCCDPLEMTISVRNLLLSDLCYARIWGAWGKQLPCLRGTSAEFFLATTAFNVYRAAAGWWRTLRGTQQARRSWRSGVQCRRRCLRSSWGRP